MPSLTFFTSAAGIILQYTLLGLIYYFLFRIGKVIYSDLRRAHPAPVRLPTGGSITEKPPAILTIVDKGSLAANVKNFSLRDNTSIGRGRHNDICIDNNFVSHEHACITLYNDEYWLVDLHSTNGTWLNGVKINDEVVLHAGDIIKIGDVAFHFER